MKSSVKCSFCNYHLGARHLRTAVSPWATLLLIGIMRKSSAITGDKIFIVGKHRGKCHYHILWLLASYGSLHPSLGTKRIMIVIFYIWWLALSGSRLGFWEKHVFAGSPGHYRSSIIAFLFLPGFDQRKSVSVPLAFVLQKLISPKSVGEGVTTLNNFPLLKACLIWILIYFHFS